MKSVFQPPRLTGSLGHQPTINPGVVSSRVNVAAGLSSHKKRAAAQSPFAPFGKAGWGDVENGFVGKPECKSGGGAILTHPAVVMPPNPQDPLQEKIIKRSLIVGITGRDRAYLAELVRYIHLNPVRARIVADMDALERYPYAGHSALMGRAKRYWQDTQGVLSRFGKTIGVARRHYRQFVHAG